MVPLSDSGNHCTIADYVKFVGINKNKEMVLEKLINNDIDDYEIFNKDWLTDSQNLRAWVDCRCDCQIVQGCN